MIFLILPNLNFIFTWMDVYVNKNNKMVGLYDILPDQLTSLKITDQLSSLKVGDQLKNYKPRSGNLIYLVERKK